MAAPSLNVARAPVARPVAIETDLGNTLSGKLVKVSGPQHFASNGYLLLGASLPGNQVAAMYEGPNVLFVGDFLEGTHYPNVIVREKILAAPGNVTAATLARAFSPTRRPSFYPDLLVATSVFSWVGEQPATTVAVMVQDRRFEQFYDRISRIERGEWDSSLGRLPSGTALAKTRTVLGQLAGGTIAPAKLVGGDGRLAIYFLSGVKYSSIEILNQGTMLFLNSSGQGVPHVERFALRNLPSVISQIRAHLA